MKQQKRPSIERYRQVLEYCDGTLVWKVRLSSRNAPGQEAGCTKGDAGYCLISVDGHTLSAHWIVWALHAGEWPASGKEIDHINGVRTDNRIENLRLVDRVQQQCNTKLRKDNALGIRGVCWDQAKQLYKAQIRFKKVQYNIGHFPTPELAAEAYRDMSAKLHGEYARAT